MIMQTFKIAVLGAGSGGQAFAAHLKQKGHEIRLWNRTANTLEQIKENKGIKIGGAIEAYEYPDSMSTKISEIINNAEIILVVVPAHAHKDIANLISHYISEEQLIILNPGRTAGALEFCNILDKNNVNPLPIIAETQSLCYTCRTIKPGVVDLLAIKNHISIGTMPAWEGKNILKDLRSIYNNPVMEDSTLKVGLENIGAILHPTPVLLNIGWIESRNVFFPHYYYGISKTIADLLEKLDLERISIASEYGYRIKSVKEWHGDVYGLIKDNLYETLQANSSYASIDAPYNLNHRYIFEDVPTGLVPISALGKPVNVSTPIINLIISLANTMLGKDFITIGRNLKTMKIVGLQAEEIKERFQGYNPYK